MAFPFDAVKNGLRHQAWLPIVVVAVGVVVTILLYQALENREDQLTEARFQAMAEDHVHVIETRTQEVFEAVRLMAGVYQNNEDVPWRDFRLYANSLQQRRPGLRVLVWAPRVPDEERAAFEAAVPSVDSEEFTILEKARSGERVPAEQREEYFPVYFVQPFETHEPLWGIDLAAHPEADEAIDRTARTSRPQATAPIILLSELKTMRSIWVFQGIVEDQRVANDLDENPGPEPLRGLVVGAFDPREMMDAILPPFWRRNIVLEIRDVEAPAPYDLIYRSHIENDVEPLDPATDVDEDAANDEKDAAIAQWRMVPAGELTENDLPLPDHDLLRDEPVVHADEVTIAGRTWRIVAAPTDAFVQDHQTWAPLAVLAGGLGVTVLLGLYLNNMLTRARQVEQEVEQRTAELRNMATALRRSNQSLEEFAYIASHDLQEPLRKVRGFSEMLISDAGDALGEQQRDYLQRMQNAAGRMQDLITGLLAYSRVTTQSQSPQLVDLTQIVEQVVADLELRIEETKGRVEVEGLPNIEADPLQMRQLFQNLISNALKFHRPGVPPEVHIRGAAVQAGRCRIEVQDNGIGFEPEQAERIFKPFQRLHGRDVYDGTGMGLPVCKKIVERHGGSIIARSQPGEGSTFTVILPCRQEYGETGHGWSKPQIDHHSDG